MRSCVTNVLVIPSSCFANHPSGHWATLSYSGCWFHTTSNHCVSFLTCSWIKLKIKSGWKWSADSFCTGFLLGYVGPQNTVLSLEKQELKWKVIMQTCNAAKNAGGPRYIPEYLSEKQIKLRVVLVSQKYLVITVFKLWLTDNQSATEKFSVLSGEFYNLPAQLPDFGSFLGAWWHCFGLLCHCPLFFLSSPFLVLATLHRDLYKMTEKPPSSLFLQLCQLFNTGWS